MQRSIVQHQIQLTLYIYEVYVKIPEADHFSIGWRIGKQTIETANKITHDERARVIINSELTLNVKMAYDTSTETYKQKKGFLMFFYSAKNENKLGGVLAIDIAKQLTEQNKQLEYLLEDYPLEKGPDKTAAICLGFRWKLLSESSFLNKSFYLNESMHSIRSEKRHGAQKQIEELSKQNHEIRLENQSLKEQVNAMVREVQSLLIAKQHLEEENRYLRTIQNQNSLRYEIEIEEINNNMENSKIKSVLSENDLQDLRALELIRQECLKLQSLKTEDSENTEYKEQLHFKDQQIDRLNDILSNNKDRIETLQYLNNLLLKEEETKQLKITKLEENIDKITIAYNEMNIKKDETEIRLEQQIQILTGKNDEMEAEIVQLKEDNTTLAKQILQERQSTMVLKEHQKESVKHQQQIKVGINQIAIKERIVIGDVIRFLRDTNVSFTKLKTQMLKLYVKNSRNSNFTDMFGSLKIIEAGLHSYLELFGKS